MALHDRKFLFTSGHFRKAGIGLLIITVLYILILIIHCLWLPWAGHLLVLDGPL